MSGVAGKGCDILVPFNERKPLSEIERSIITKYRSKIWSKFLKAVRDFNLVEEGDRVAVAVSGGKDSILMAKMFQEMQKHGNIKFELEFIVADPGYHESIKELLLNNCKYLDIPIQIFDSEIFRIVDEIAKDYPCFMCAKMRRGALYSKARSLNCNKLALGHHYNDVIETTMLNLLYSGCFKTMLPKLKSANFEGIELIRPLYYIDECHIESFIKYSGIWPLNCACMVAAEKIANRRYEIKELIKQLKDNFVDVDKSIFKAAQNVNLDSILGWQQNGEKYSYLDFYNEE
jgi:tRNA(Ile)-lysidine synthase TilS/MesJ